MRILLSSGLRPCTSFKKSCCFSHKLTVFLEKIQDILPMLGEICSIYGCSASRRYTGVAFFKVPKETDDFTKKWTSELINIITKDRVVDDVLRKKINDSEHKKLWICELHFSPEQIWCYETKKKLKDGELPSFNLPRKSSESSASSVVSQSSSLISKREDSQLLLENSFALSYYYKNFAGFKK